MHLHRQIYPFQENVKIKNHTKFLKCNQLLKMKKLEKRGKSKKKNQDIFFRSSLKFFINKYCKYKRNNKVCSY